LRYLADWHDDAANVAPEERATVADFRLLLGQQNVCLHLLGAETVDHLSIPLYAIAEGLAHDWWTLFGNRDNDELVAERRRCASLFHTV